MSQKDTTQNNKRVALDQIPIKKQKTLDFTKARRSSDKSSNKECIGEANTMVDMLAQVLERQGRAQAGIDRIIEIYMAASRDDSSEELDLSIKSKK